MTTFSQQEVEFLQNHGNEVSATFAKEEVEAWVRLSLGFRFQKGGRLNGVVSINVESEMPQMLILLLYENLMMINFFPN